MKRSKFSLSNYKLLSCNGGELIPIGIQEVLPGDTFQHSTSALIRLSPLLAPVMHPLHARIHHWFVPFRLIWEDWEDFITGGPDGLDDSEFPTIRFTDTFPAVGGYANLQGSLADYLGVPPNLEVGSGTYDVSALPFRAYSLIWNEWYRDQDLQTEQPISLASGQDTTTNVSKLRCSWEKDYFTTARPWTQKGPDVSIPFASQAPITGIAKSTQVFGAGASGYETDGSGTVSYSSHVPFNGTLADHTFLAQQDPNNPGYPNIRANLSDAPGSINALREAFAIQRYEEARARYGSRYTEYLRYLGVKSSDARLQRPEYLGGGKQTIQFSEVLQTSPVESESYDNTVGALKGHGIGAMRSNRYRRFFEEHGFVITLLSIKPTTIYTQGLNKLWNRRTKEDFFQKELQHIGQQEIPNKEIYRFHTNPENTFGYQDRYAEYRQGFSSIAGEFRDTLDYWHMARIFESNPALNSTFVNCVPTDRIFAAKTTLADSFYIMAKHSIQARRIVSANSNSFVF